MSRRSASEIFRYTLIAIIGLVGWSAHAQQGDIYFGVGHASYSYSELKEYQQNLLKQLQTHGVSGTVTDQFPAYFTFFAGFTKHWQQVSLGFEVGHGSSGGRVYYEDYSGKYVGDQVVKYNYLAATPSFFIKRAKRIWITGGAKVTTTLSSVALKHALTVGGATVSDNAIFKGFNIGVQPNVALRYFPIDKFFLQGTIGYEIQGPSELRMSTDKEVWLDNGEGEPVHLQGMGYRLGLAMGIAF